MDENGNYTPAQARESGFNSKAYSPADEGVFMGKLVMKIYGDFCLRCYFVTADKRGIKPTAYQNRRTGRYGPRGCGADFKTVPLQTIWSNRVGRSKTGKLAWIGAAEL